MIDSPKDSDSIDRAERLELSLPNGRVITASPTLDS